LHSSTNISSGEALPEVVQLHHYHKKTECHAVQAPKRGRKQHPQINKTSTSNKRHKSTANWASDNDEK
jgi:hypothetical protein